MRAGVHGVAQPTVAEFAERYLAEVAARDRKDVRPVRRMVERDLLPQLGRMMAGEVTAAALREIVFAKRDAGRPSAALAVLELARRIFAYARVCGLRPDNPAEATPARFVHREQSRRRYLSEPELRRFLRGLGLMGAEAAGFAELLLLTLARKSELRLARWAEVDLERRIWEIPAENSKTGVPHLVYLSGRAAELLGRQQEPSQRRPEDYVFADRNSATQPKGAAWINKALARVDWEMQHFTPHDLRRTGNTWLRELGYRQEVVEKAMNHAIKGVEGVYNRAAYAEERRRMLEEWAAWIEDRR